MWFFNIMVWKCAFSLLGFWMWYSSLIYPTIWLNIILIHYAIYIIILILSCGMHIYNSSITSLTPEVYIQQPIIIPLWFFNRCSSSLLHQKCSSQAVFLVSFCIRKWEFPSSIIILCSFNLTSNVTTVSKLYIITFVTSDSQTVILYKYQFSCPSAVAWLIL